MRESQRPLIEDGRNRYGTSMPNLKNAGFTYCVTCDESISQSQIDQHKKEGHKVEVNGDGGVKNSTATCTCGCDSAEHTYGTAECQSCSCKKFHLKNADEGQSKLLHQWVDGKCKTCGITKTENSAEMCNQTELGPYPAPGMKNNVAEGRARYGRKII